MIVITTGGPKPSKFVKANLPNWGSEESEQSDTIHPVSKHGKAGCTKLSTQGGNYRIVDGKTGGG